MQYFIDVYGEEEGPKKFEETNEKKLLTKKNFIRKYGEKIGEEKWSSYLNSLQYHYSKKSLSLFQALAEGLKDHVLYFGDNEKKLQLENERRVSLDFFDETTQKAVEFFGDYFHANPHFHQADEWFSQMKMTADEIWKRDAERLKYIENVGINVKVIWESDEININDIVEWLKK